MCAYITLMRLKTFGLKNKTSGLGAWTIPLQSLEEKERLGWAGEGSWPGTWDSILQNWKLCICPSAGVWPQSEETRGDMALFWGCRHCLTLPTALQIWPSISRENPPETVQWSKGNRAIARETINVCQGWRWPRIPRHLLNTYCVPGTSQMSSCNPFKGPGRQVGFSPCSRWGKWGSRRFCGLTEATKLKRARFRSQVWLSPFLVLLAYGTFQGWGGSREGVPEREAPSSQGNWSHIWAQLIPEYWNFRFCFWVGHSKKPKLIMRWWRL